MHPLLFIALALALVVLISGGYTFVVACRRRKDLPWLVEEEIKKTSYGQYYHGMVAADKWLKDHGAQDVYIRSSDGLKLHGLWIPAQQPKGTMLLVHGYRSTKLADFGLVFDFYHSLGMNLLIPEHRCHGESEGQYITFGVKESGDMLQWLYFHNERFGPCPVVLSGLSMGASTVMYMADEALPSNVCGIIADCGFTSPYEIIKSVFRRVTHLPAGPALLAAELFARLLAGFGLRQKDSRKTLRSNKLPIIMVHGLADDFVPSRMTREGYAVCAGDKQLLLVEGAGHGVSFLVEREKYTQLVLEFLRKNVEGFA